MYTGSQRCQRLQVNKHRGFMTGEQTNREPGACDVITPKGGRTRVLSLGLAN